MSKREILFPVTADGGLAYYATPGRATVYGGGDLQTVSWVPKYVFDRPLTYQDFFKGRSAACFVFEDENGAGFTMGMSALSTTILLGRFDGKVARGPWTFAKQGTSYFVVPAE